MEAKFPVGAVFTITKVSEDNLVIIADKFKPDPKFFKCIGGRVEKGETLIQTIAREFEEEVNLRISPESFEELLVIDVENAKVPHSILFYSLEIPEVSLEDMKPGYEVEEIKVVDQKTLEKMICYREVLPKHAMAHIEYFQSIRA